MKRSTFYLIMAAVCVSIVWTSCSYNSPEAPVFNVTQAQLDAATIIPSSQDTAITGDPFNGFSTDTLTTKHKLRDLFANISLDQNIVIGTITTRKAYYYSVNGNERDSLLNVVVMVKREPGYYPEGGDWEYMDIKYNKNTNYIANPNGILLELSDNIVRGKIAKCANCHAKAGANFVFHRSK